MSQHRLQSSSGRCHPTRHRSSPLGFAGIAACAAVVVVAWSWIPVLWVGLASRFEAFSPWSSATAPAGDGALQGVLLFAFALVFQSALQRVENRRMLLTRPLFGAVACLVAVVCASRGALWLELDPALLPVGLAGLWVGASYGTAAGLLTALGTVGGVWLSGPEGSGLGVLLVRAGLPALLLTTRRPLWSGFWASLASGASVAFGLFVGADHSPPGGGPVWTGSFLIAAGLVEGALYVSTRGLGERLLGHVSRERLHALLDLEQPLLKRMVTRSPGSFEHSRAMANLAEQAASAIGADALLTRVGAYYHDLGKSIEPKYFVENLDRGEANPHDELSPLESSRRIIRHVVEGVGILRGGGIPEPVVEFAYTHHGTQRVEYFLNKERKLCELMGQEVDEAAFRYPGMRPGTKETAILMLVDSIEAASRTVQVPARSHFEEMVRRVVFTKLGSGQLDDSGLSLEELRIVCARVVETLVHMHHHRIEYPWQKDRARQFGVGEGELGNESPRRRAPVTRREAAEGPEPDNASDPARKTA